MRRMQLVMAAATCVAAVARPVAAQSFVSDDPVIKRIWAIGMDSSETMHLSQTLFDSIGPRLTGSPNLKRGNDWLVKTYASWGIDAKNEQYGTWRGWRRGYSHIELVEPRVRSLEGTMLGSSPGTGMKDLTAQTVILPRFADSSAFVQWLPSAKGKFVLVAGPQPTCRPTDDWDQNATVEAKAQMDSLRAGIQREWTGRNVRGTGYSLAIGTGELGLRLEQGGVAGIITSRPKNGWGTIEVFETYDTQAPAIALSCEDYGLVYRLTEHNQHAVVRMNLDATLLGEQPVFNTVATIKGTTKPDEYIVLSAHFDSWDASSGATDNGTGTITMLEAMRILKMVYPHPARTIIAGHWSGEEKGAGGVPRVQRRPPGSGQRVAGALQSGQWHRAHCSDECRWPAGRRGAHQQLAVTGAARIPEPDHLHRRRIPGGRRERQRVLCVLWCAGLLAGGAPVGLR